MEENKVASDSVFCKACGKEVFDATRVAAEKEGGWIVYCSYECYCDD